MNNKLQGLNIFFFYGNGFLFIYLIMRFIVIIIINGKLVIHFN